MAKQESAVRVSAAARAESLAQKGYVRFSLAQRVEHVVLLVSFTLLALTGLPQKYAGATIAESLIKGMGGIETIRTVHHISAIVFVMMAIYHFVVLVYKVFVLRTELTMLPGLRDAMDALGVIRYNLGLDKKRPALPRYGFEEKAEYWAMIWGTIVMALTGFMLWNPILFTKILPGQVIPAAKAAHGGEAVLAVLAILVWHFYNVHIKSWNTSMWTGRLSEHAMAEEHGEELARVKDGQVRPRPTPEVARQRARVVMPAAIIVALLMTAGIAWLATAEQTAITTVPTPEPKAFVPLPPTLAPTAAAAQIGSPIPHEIAGREACDTCHGPQSTLPYPADHAGRPNTSCQVCHQAGTPAPGGAQSVAASIPHPIEGRTDCLMCHKEGGLNPVPADHAGRSNESCTACHQINPGISGTPAAASTPEASAAGTTSAAGGALAIPHDVAGKEQCDTCHGPNGLKPAPKDHEGRSNDTCTTCHKAGSSSSAATTPAAETSSGSTGVPNPIPHDLAGKEQCSTCHAAGGMKPVPADHEKRPDSGCTMCHAEASNGTSSAATPAAAAAAVTASASSDGGAPTAGGPAAIPHDLAGKEQCDTCHGPAGLKPMPADHKGRPNDGCTMCHQSKA